MKIETRTFCPLGRECRTIQDNVIHECLWLTKVQGMNPQTGEQTDDERCAISWLPILSVQQARETHSTSAAVESLRNHVAESAQQNAPLAALGRMIQGRLSDDSHHGENGTPALDNDS